MSEECRSLQGKYKGKWCVTHNQAIWFCLIDDLKLENSKLRALLPIEPYRTVQNLRRDIYRFKKENKRLRSDLEHVAFNWFHGEGLVVSDKLKQYLPCPSPTSAGKESLAASVRAGHNPVIPPPTPAQDDPKAEAGDTDCICGHSYKWHNSIGLMCLAPKCQCSEFQL